MVPSGGIVIWKPQIVDISGLTCERMTIYLLCNLNTKVVLTVLMKTSMNVEIFIVHK